MVNSDGSIIPYLPIDNRLVAESVKAISVGALFNGKTEALYYFYVDPQGRDEAIQRDAGGSGGEHEPHGPGAL